MKTKTKFSKQTATMVECAILIALGTILSIIPTPHLPWGGSITVGSMLPLVIIGYRHGLKWGMFSSTIYSLIQMLLGGGTISAAFAPGNMKWYLAVLMVLLDYLFAFSLVGLSGLFRNKEMPSKSLALGALVGTSARFVMHFLSGWILWGAWASWFFEDFDSRTGGSFGKFVLTHFDGQMLSCVYSLIYNGLYMIPEIIITVVLAIFIGKIPQISKELK